MNRRGFLASILALGAAPAIVRAGSLMQLWVPRQQIFGIGRLMGFPDDGSLYIALFTSDSGLVAVCNEATYEGYARQEVQRDVASFLVENNVVKNAKEIVFPVREDGVFSVDGFSIIDERGVPVASGLLSTRLTISQGVTPSFKPESIIIEA